MRYHFINHTLGTLRWFSVDTTSISHGDVVDLKSYVDATLS